jgi:biotin transporter BioY
VVCGNTHLGDHHQGYLVENHGWDRRLITACLAMVRNHHHVHLHYQRCKRLNVIVCQIIGDLSIYVVGIPWLAHFIGWSDGSSSFPPQHQHFI